MVVTALGHAAVASASCFNGVNMLHIEYHQPLAFIKSHQGTNKSVCTLIKHEKKKDNSCLKTFTENWDSKAPSVGTFLAYLETTA